MLTTDATTSPVPDPRSPASPGMGVSVRLTHVAPTSRTRARPKNTCGSGRPGSAVWGATTVIRRLCTCRSEGLPSSSVSVRNGMRYRRHPDVPSGLPSESLTGTIPPSRT